MVKNFSQKCVVYHGGGAWYHDGTNEIVSKNRKCIRPTYEPFGKSQTMFVIKLKQELNLN